MHDHDQEIIMALAEGTLDDAAATAAEAAILACAECSADLELQRFALTVLDEAPDVYLTATESARLHDALKRDLVGATTPPVRTKRSFAWGRWLPAAGLAAVFLVAIVSLPTLFAGDSSDESSEMTVAAPALESAETRAATETTAAATQEMLSDTVGGADDGAMNLEAATEATEAPAAAATTAAPTETTASDLSYYDALPFLGYVDDLDRDDLLEEVTSNRIELRASSGQAKALDPAFASCVLTNTSAEVAPTLGIPVDGESLLLGLALTPGGEEVVVVAYVPDDVDETVFATQQVYICEVVDFLP